MRGVRFQAGQLKEGGRPAGTQASLCFPRIRLGQQGAASQDHPVWSLADLSRTGCIWGLPLAFGEGHCGKEHSQISTMGVVWRLALTVVTVVP